MRFIDGEPVIVLGECGEVPIKRLSEFTYTPPAPLHTATKPIESTVKAQVDATLDAYIMSRRDQLTGQCEVQEMAELTERVFREHPELYNDVYRPSVSNHNTGPTHYEQDPNDLAAIDVEVKRLRDADSTLSYADAVTKVNELFPQLFEDRRP